MKRGGLEISWSTCKVKKFREQPLKRIVDDKVALPDLYLHFLSSEFLVQDNEVDPALRGGNDNTELQIALPAMYSEHSCGQQLEPELKRSLAKALDFLRFHGEPLSSKVEKKPGGFGPKVNFKATCDCDRLYYTLRTARPKATVSLDKHAFGIPEDSDLYLFVQNHGSVSFMDDEEIAAFEACLDELQEHGDLLKLHTFIKVFYEGGFAYNTKISAADLAASGGYSGGSTPKGSMGTDVSSAYLPKNVGIACMSIVPAFEGQVGISTGYPYTADSRLTPFMETVPVSISTIQEMSSLHKRYGLCFTRCVFVWADEDFEKNQTLNFISVLPHGGFYYVPKTPKEHHEYGGLIYAFGESKEDAINSMSL